MNNNVNRASLGAKKNVFIQALEKVRNSWRKGSARVAHPLLKFAAVFLLLFVLTIQLWADNATYYVWDNSRSDWVPYLVQDENLSVIEGPTIPGYTFIGWHIWNPTVYPYWLNTTGGNALTTGYIASGGSTADKYYQAGGENSKFYIRYVPRTAGNTAEKNTGKNEADNKLYAVYQNGSTSSWAYNSGWTASTTDQITVTFKANGGTGSDYSQKMLKSTSTVLHVCEFEAPSGKTFAGWATSSGGSVVYSDMGSASFASNQTLYAKWEDAGTYTVTYHLTGVTLSSGYPTQVTSSEDFISIPFEINSGYTSEGIYAEVCVTYSGEEWCYNTGGDMNIEFAGNRVDYVNDGYFSSNVDVTITAQESTCITPTVAFASGVNHTVTVGASGWTDAATATYNASSTGQTITYSSSNSSVASVNSGTGAVTIGATAGTATIVVTAASNATYCEATASYTVTVNPNLPTVSATESGKELNYTTLKPTSVTLNGGVIKDYGGGTISAHGYVYGTTTTPTLSDGHSDWNQTRAIDKVWGNQYPTGLTPGTTYYVRCYATNQAGTGYSPTYITFTTPNQYTISLNNQSATTTGTESVTVWENSDHNLTGTPAITLPTKTGYNFGGYYTEINGGGAQIIAADGSVNASAGGGNTYTDASKNWKYGNNITLYANWIAKNYTITLINQSATSESTPTSIIVTYNASTNLTGTVVTTLPVKTGYTFGGYYTGISGSGVQLITETGVVVAGVTNYTDGDKKWIRADDVTVYAKWTANEIELELSANGGESDGSAVVLYDATGLKAGTLTHAEYEGHTLVGYYKEEGHTNKVLNSDGSFAGDVSTYIESGKWVRTTSPTTLYAFWATEVRTVTFDKQGHGGDNIAQEVEYNTTVTRPTPDPTDVDYNFGGWYQEAGCVNEFNFSTPITTNTTVYAKWTPKTYKDLIFACVDLTLVTEDGSPAMVTSRNGINVMAMKKLKVTVSGALEGHRVTISGTDLKFYKNDGTRYIELTGSNSLVAPLDEQIVYVSYNPSSAGTGAFVTPDITIACDGFEEVISGKVKARNLPDAVAIVARVGNTWQALPADISTGNPAPVMVSTAVEGGILKAYGPSTLSYKLWSTAVVASNNSRWGDVSTAYTPSAQFGDRLRFAGIDNHPLWANNSKTENTISNKSDATLNSAGHFFTNDEGYEWIVTTTEVAGEFVYTLQTEQTQNSNNLRLWGSKWGTYSDTYGTAELYFLPLVPTEPADVSIMEWGTNEIAVKYANAGNVASGTFKAQIGDGAQTSVTATQIGGAGDVWKLTGVGNLQSNPAKTLVLTMTESSIAKQAVFPIPLIVTDSKTEAQLSSCAAGGNGSTLITEGRAIAKGLDVIIRNGGTLTTGTAQGKFANLYIYPGGKADISNNIGFSNIYLRGGFSWLEGTEKDYRLPQMKVGDDITIDGVQSKGNGIYYDLCLDKRRYYMFAVPKDVRLSDATNEENTDNFTAWLKQYNGQGRTLTPKVSGWTTSITGNTLYRGIGYEMSIKPRNERIIGIVRLPLLKATAWTNEGDCMPAVKAWGYNDENVTANNKGWNFIGNPYFTSFQVSAADGTVMEVRDLVEHKPDGVHWDGTYDWTTGEQVRYVTIPQKMYDDYYDERALGYKLESFYPFFIQAKIDGNLTFTGSPVLKAAPSLFRSAIKAREVIIDFTISDNNGTTDKAGLTISDNYSADFDMEDKEKTIVNTDYLKVYTMVGEYRTAFNSLPEAAAAMPIPVGYIAPTAGEYTIVLPEDGNYTDVKNVYLSDYSTGSTIDLLTEVEGYTFETEAGEINNRLALNVILKAEGEEPVSTGIDGISDDEVPIKFIYQDKIYIRHKGVIYDATGKKVREINK